MSTGLFVGGPTEARAAGFRRGDNDPTQVPTVRPPKWDTQMLYTREGILDLLTREWGRKMTADDVTAQVRDLPIAYHVPFPDMPEIPPSDDPRSEHRDRMRAITEHESRRESTRKSREVYDIRGVPMFVPSWAKPGPNDSPAENNRRADFIANLNPKD